MAVTNENNVRISGEILHPWEFSHSFNGQDFYVTTLSSLRGSIVSDNIVIIASEKYISPKNDMTGEYVEIAGHFRSCNIHEDGKSHLLLYVSAKRIETIEPCFCDTNSIEITGYICQKPIYRKTPLGRDITDMILAVNRPYDKSDYIPCICWGRNAFFAENMEVGTLVKLRGRIQSRRYEKKISETVTESRIAYEVSAQEIEVLESGGENA